MNQEKSMLVVYVEGGRIELRRRARPRKPKGWALLKLRVAGICNTDLELVRGYYGFRGTPGHEFVAEVVEADSPQLVGRRVVGEINVACGDCEWCRRDLGRHCPRRRVLGIAGLDGAFSEYFTLPERNLHDVPEGVTDEEAVFAEPVAAACEILEQVALPRDAEVAVLGDGKLGLLVAQVLASHGARVVLWGRHREKLAIAEATGVRTALVGRLPRARYDWVVEATGSRLGLEQAVGMARPRGTVIVKTTVKGAVRLDTAPVVVNEITLVGSRCGPFEPALALLASRKLRLRELISGEYGLEEAPRAFRAAARRGTLKILLRAAAS
ncbi:MAG: alcohol dehydrogenase catalytic domain-containing protein [Bryobacterales bacterium]|nr:alcohol dehydrogenase catalytic domain-containing protein [Bryobacteraceae bacterium]MDW8131474.1 alcohol dehydrogenase catalytic domain-containing protein [Bryobacterales bacterium]